jgi:ABC-type dipeptide/oligopeptide/nickel transport system ATPase component
VSVQAAVLRLLKQLQDELGLALLFITHDLAVVATVADRVLVLDQGRLLESGPTDVILNSPKHPYTRGLLAAAPSVHVALGTQA